MAQYLYSSQQIRQIEQKAIAQLQDDFILMQRAGREIAQKVTEICSQQSRILLLCGSGNNGGDGLVAAAGLLKAGFDIDICFVTGSPNKLKGAAKKAWEVLSSTARVRRWDSIFCQQYDLIIDAIIGIGLQKNLRQPLADIVRQVNQCNKLVLAIDVPTGLDSDTGAIMGDAIKATQTLSFVAGKRGLYTRYGPDYCGELLEYNLGVNADKFADSDKAYHLLDQHSHFVFPQKQQKESHKGTYGTMLAVGGEGAIILAGLAALYSGTGKVVVNAAERWGNFPYELIYTAPDQLENWLSKSNVVLFGPGAGINNISQQQLQTLLEYCTARQKPLVLDADALTLLAQQPRKLTEQTILTPHPKEAAGLLSWKVEQVQNNRFAALEALREKYQCNIVLKGNGSLIATPKQRYLCKAGSPALATAGSGDILAGITAAILAQGFDAAEASFSAVLIHALISDNLCQQGQTYQSAMDLLNQIKPFLSGYARKK